MSTLAFFDTQEGFPHYFLKEKLRVFPERWRSSSAGGARLSYFTPWGFVLFIPR